MELYKFCNINSEVITHFRKNELLKYNLLSDLEKVKSQVLYINGTTNPLHRKISAERTAKFRNAKVQIELMVGDGFTTVENPESVVNKIHTFVDKFAAN